MYFAIFIVFSFYLLFNFIICKLHPDIINTEQIIKGTNSNNTPIKAFMKL